MIRNLLGTSTAGGIGSIPCWGTKILHATRCSQKKKKKSPKAGTVGSKYNREKADSMKGVWKHYQSCWPDTRHMTLGLSPEGKEKHLESRMCAQRWKAIIRLFHDLTSLSQMLFISGALLFRQQPKSLVKSKSFLAHLYVTFLAYL